MAIVVICPSCKVRLTLGDDRAGTIFSCPRCAAAISVSASTPSATPPPPSVRPAAVPSASPLPAPLPAPARPVDEESPVVGSGKPWVHNRRRVLVVGMLLLVALSTFIWLGLRNQVQPVDKTSPASAGTLPPPPDIVGDGPDWTYKELLDYLRSRGLQPLRMGPSDRGDGQIYVFVDDEAKPSQFCAFYCLKTDSVRAAKERAGRKEKGAYAWGRFCFEGDVLSLHQEEVLQAVRQALTGREMAKPPRAAFVAIDVR